MAKSVLTHLMFEGSAEQAMNFYVSLIPGSKIIAVDRYDAAGPGPAGSIRTARFELLGREFLCIDSFIKHAFTFTPSVSIFVECESLEEIQRLASGLGDGGKELMPLGNYGFSQQFAWVQDRFGVSWQVNLA